MGTLVRGKTEYSTVIQREQVTFRGGQKTQYDYSFEGHEPAESDGALEGAGNVRM